MKQIKCSYEDFISFCRLYETMGFKAGTYVPTIEEVKKEIVPNLPEYMLFLIWIDTTGEENKENTKVRKLIRSIINHNLVITDTDVKRSAAG